MSINFNFETAEKVETVNSRTNYDLRFSARTGKFNLSQRAYNRLDINNNGFNLIKDSEGNVALTLQPNDQSTIHRGRSDADQKGLTFTANALANMLDLEEGGEDAHYTLEPVDHEGVTYYIPTLIGEDSPSITDEDQNDEEVGAPEDVMMAEEESQSGW